MNKKELSRLGLAVDRVLLAIARFLRSRNPDYTGRPLLAVTLKFLNPETLKFSIQVHNVTSFALDCPTGDLTLYRGDQPPQVVTYVDLADLWEIRVSL